MMYAWLFVLSSFILNIVFYNFEKISSHWKGQIKDIHLLTTTVKKKKKKSEKAMKKEKESGNPEIYCQSSF